MDDIITIEECITRLDAIRHEIVPDSRDHFALSSGIAALYEMENGAPAVNRWIPCSERLPHGGRVLATTKQGYVVDVIFVAKGSQWFRNGECFPTDTVIAWMPMPDAYKPPEKE